MYTKFEALQDLFVQIYGGECVIDQRGAGNDFMLENVERQRWMQKKFSCLQLPQPWPKIKYAALYKY